MLVTFLFWNLKKNPLYSRIANIVASHGVDIVMVAESEIDPPLMEETLQGAGRGGFHYTKPYLEGVEGVPSKVDLYTRFDPSTVSPQFVDASGRVSIRLFHLNGSQMFLLAMAHLIAKPSASDYSQVISATEVARDIVKTEEYATVWRTILVGDLNMDPFHPGVYSAGALNGMMTKQLASRGHRTVGGKDFRTFYNPMWSHFGDRSHGPAGTYFYGGSDYETCFWHTLDQVMVRPELADSLKFVRILDSDGADSLVSPMGRPLSERISDHLPLLFQIDL